MRRGRGWLIAALIAVLVGAFGVQASSTWLLAEQHQVEVYARPFLILMLEVGSITGAALYLATRDPVTRRSAGLLVMISSGVGGVGGVTRYGVLLGVATGATLLLLVHTLGRFWHEAPAERERDVPTVPGVVPDLPESVSADRESIPAPPPDEPAPDMPADMPEVDHEPEPTRLHAVPRRRNRDELERAGRALPDDLVVRRKAGESVESLRGRVEEAEEKARRRARLNA